MTKFLVHVHLAGLVVITRLEDRTARRRDDHGSTTIEQVLWAVFALMLAGGAYVAMRAFVTSESGKIK